MERGHSRGRAGARRDSGRYLDTSWTQALFLCTEHIVITHIILLFCCIIEDLTKKETLKNSKSLILQCKFGSRAQK